MAGPYHIVALIPAHDEGPRIAAVVEVTAQHLPVVVVDDGSADDTAAQAEAAGATVLRQAPNAGKGAALRAGFRFALDSGFEAVVTLDADGQHDPSEIPRFLEAYAAQAADRPGLIIGRRRFAEMPLARRLSNVVGGLILSAAVGRWIPDNQSGFRLIGPTLMREMLESVESGFEFEVEMIARCIALRRPIRWVPIRTIYLGETSHIRPWRHSDWLQPRHPESPGDRAPRAVIKRGLVLAAIPKYGLERAMHDPYSLPHSRTDPTPCDPGVPDRTKRPVERGTLTHGIDGRQRTGTDAHCDRSRRDAPPAREHGEAPG